MEKHRALLEFFEPILGTCPANKDLAAEYVATKAPTIEKMDEELEAITADELIKKGMTVFARNDDGVPCLWDYQVKGFLKDTCGILRKVEGSRASKIKAYKKEIDGLIFPAPRMIPIKFDGEIGSCQRPLRASTPQGERVSLSNSEEIPAGASIEVEFTCFTFEHWLLVKECLDYGFYRGIGQWRNSGKGRFTWRFLG